VANNGVKGFDLKVFNILIAGVGGQGVLLTSKIIAEAALLQGLDVKQSEVHGMAQRGGAVTTHIRYGEKVYSPLIEPGGADLLVAFEKIEALRFAHYLAPGGVVVANRQEIHPPSVLRGLERYPADVDARLHAVTDRVFLVDALASALALKEVRAVNVVMVGAASHFLPLPVQAYEDALRLRLPAKLLDANLAAFRAGRDLLKGANG
jgi:indolepyruvate ferredoxin oxidoreductase beta subunit